MEKFLGKFSECGRRCCIDLRIHPVTHSLITHREKFTSHDENIPTMECRHQELETIKHDLTAELTSLHNHDINAIQRHCQNDATIHTFGLISRIPGTALRLLSLFQFFS